MTWPPDAAARGREKVRLKWLGRKWPCGHPLTRDNTKYGKVRRCAICAEKEPKHTKTHFRCGHERVPDNIYTNAGQERCKTCHRAQAREYQYKTGRAKTMRKPLRPLLLAEVWK